MQGLKTSGNILSASTAGPIYLELIIGTVEVLSEPCQSTLQRLVASCLASSSWSHQHHAKTHTHGIIHLYHFGDIVCWLLKASL